MVSIYRIDNAKGHNQDETPSPFSGSNFPPFSIVLRNVEGFLLKLPSSDAAIFAMLDCPLTSLEAAISSRSSGAITPVRASKVLAERGRRNTLGELEKDRAGLLIWAWEGPRGLSLLTANADVDLNCEVKMRTDRAERMQVEELISSESGIVKSIITSLHALIWEVHSHGSDKQRSASEVGFNQQSDSGAHADTRIRIMLNKSMLLD